MRRFFSKNQQWISNLPLVMKLIAVNMFLIAFPLLVLLPLTNRSVTALVQEELGKYSFETVQQISKNVSVLFNNLSSPINVLIADEDLQAGLSYPADGYELEKISRYQSVESSMYSLFTGSLSYTSILVYGFNGQIYHVGFDIKDYSYDYASLYDAYENQRFIGTHIRDYATQSNPVVSIFRPIYSIKDRQLLGYMIADIDYDYLDQLIVDTQITESSDILIVKGNHIIYSQDPKKVDAVLNNDLYNHICSSTSGTIPAANPDQSNYVFCAIDGTDWKVISEHSMATYTQKTNKLINSTLLTAILLLSVSILLLVLISSAITRPLRKLTSLMEAAKNGDYSVRFHPKYNDEIGHLGQSFNFMLTNLNSLIENVYQLQLAEKNAVIYALQAQINPHFFYNTLQMISDYAEAGDAEEVSTVCGRLSSIFRYSLEGEQKLVFFSDELEHIQNYIYIQSTRMNNRFLFTLDVPEACNNVLTPRLILQPLVENAVTHGIYSKLTGAEIIVSADIKDQNMCVQVTDNGMGMDQATLQELQKNLEESIDSSNLSSDSIGLINVHRRLVLNYGRDYGLTIQSSLNQGTVVAFKIPISQ